MTGVNPNSPAHIHRNMSMHTLAPPITPSTANVHSSIGAGPHSSQTVSPEGKEAPVRDDPPNNSGNPDVERVKNIIFRVIGIALNAFAIWKVGYLWSVSFFIGFVFRHEVKHRITDFVKSILDDGKLAATILIPGSIFFYFFQWPATLTAQAALSGADAGSRVALTLEEYLTSKSGTLLWFIRA